MWSQPGDRVAPAAICTSNATYTHLTPLAPRRQLAASEKGAVRQRSSISQLPHENTVKAGLQNKDSGQQWRPIFYSPASIIDIMA